MERIKIKNEKDEIYLLEVEKHHLDEALDQINMVGNCKFIQEEVAFKEPFCIDVMSEDGEIIIGKLTHEISLINFED